MQSLKDTGAAWFSRGCEWLRGDVKQAFTTHPHETGETYLQHLWFTLRMSARFLWVMTAMVVHGLFPFLLTRTASRQMEKAYAIMRKRISKQRRDEIEADLDYSV
ncbi:MAG: DUF6356 family protein [Alphaproteobacteria bacterium]